MKPVRCSFLPLLALFFGSFLMAQQPSPQQTPDPTIPPLLQHDPSDRQTATITANARAVVLDVVVTDGKGHVVHGLTKSDFHLVEDGAPQTLDSFHEHTFTAANAPPIPKLPTNVFTNYVPTGNAEAYTVILIDAANNSPQVQAYVRSQLIDFMKTIPAGNPVAIFQLESTGMRLVQGFSSDPAVLLAAVESKRERVEIPLIGIGQRGYAPHQFRQDNLNQGLKSMGLYLAEFPGRKNLIWFSGSIPRTYWWDGGLDSPFPDAEDFTEELSKATDALTLSRVAVYPIDARGLETDPAFSAANRRAPSINSSMNFATRRFYDHSDIEDVADRTGGKAFYNTNGLKQAVGEAIESGSNFYTIAYTPTNKKWDGSYRNIKIETTQSGLKLEYRHGYYALPETPQQSRRAAALRRIAASKPGTTTTQSSYRAAQIGAGLRSSFVDAMQLGAIPPTEILFDASISPGAGTRKLDKDATPQPGQDLPPDLRKKSLRNYNVLYAVDSHTLPFTQTPDGIHHGAFEFVTLVFDEHGVLVNSIMSNIQMNLTPTTYDEILKRGFGTKQLIAVPAKGDYFFRFGVHDTVSDRMGAMEVPVDNVKLGVVAPGQTPTP